ncbi:ADC synthase [Neofusicoccum parvum]|uniref:ADC synthase n=1 Tax=Neofusicoccum parvum TaxID=310453 RepID=A0ACB5SGU4_9PEZI|nr:ADC synthase [Neofusicoccum parvum]
MEMTRVTDGPVDSPFWGGLIGFVSYEAGLETINVHPTPAPQQAQTSSKFRKPDLAFVFVTRSIIVDHVSHKIYIQSIRDDDSDWVFSTTQKISALSNAPSAPTSTDISSTLAQCTVTIPTQPSYETKVLRCQDSIRAGDSYELCLTSQTTIHLPPPPTATFPWHLYTRLRHLNPAPFGAYIRLGPRGSGVNILSSSPERFLSWTRQGLCQYRPIKGTVRKDAGVTRADAERILNSSKERAENLMIVDLVRHDLHGVVGAGNVRVSKLMGVEEYETVFQLVSVISGDLTGGWGRDTPKQQQQQQTQDEDSSSSSPPSTTASSTSSSLAASPLPSPHISASHPLNSSSLSLAAADDEDIEQRKLPSGIDVLHASLPPGSMTGAPKKRSCELLHAIEEAAPRGIYSGVLGYLDVGGGGDFAVVIRTAWRWEGEADEGEVWRVGAGGAVTAQSTAEGEYGEMVVKLESALGVFDGDVRV